MLSIEDVEKIMEETQEGVEYQRVRVALWIMFLSIFAIVIIIL